MTHLPQRLGVSPRKFPGAVKTICAVEPFSGCLQLDFSWSAENWGYPVGAYRRWPR
jgi:hypothetical protein